MRRLVCFDETPGKPSRTDYEYRRHGTANLFVFLDAHQPWRHVRHSFAVRSLTEWYRDGVDVAARLPLLAAWLGHTHPALTYWYLQATPELLGEAARRLEASQVSSS